MLIELLLNRKMLEFYSLKELFFFKRKFINRDVLSRKISFIVYLKHDYKSLSNTILISLNSLIFINHWLEHVAVYANPKFRSYL